MPFTFATKRLLQKMRMGDTAGCGKRRLCVLVLLFLITLCGCGSASQMSLDNETASKDEQQGQGSYPRQAVELLAPAGVGSGYDLTIRSISRCLRETGLVSVPLPVTNQAGEGGGVALQYLSDSFGSDSLLSIFSAPISLIHLNGSTPLSYETDTTPIAQLIMDYGCFAVTADSSYQTITDIMEALKSDPTSIRVGGTSAVGSMDHIQFLKIAQAAGVEKLEEIPYVGFEDGGAPAKLMGGHIDLISAGISDVMGLVESGDLRVLAITAEKRVGSGIVAEMPTCVEQGIPASFYNWRGVFGPKGMPEEAVRFWEETFRQMTETEEWAEICREYGWDMAYEDHVLFQETLRRHDEEYAALLRQIGLLEAR